MPVAAVCVRIEQDQPAVIFAFAVIRSIVDAIEVDDKAIRIIGNKDVLQAVIAGKQNENGNVRGFVRKWRTRHDSNV